MLYHRAEHHQNQSLKTDLGDGFVMEKEKLCLRCMRKIGNNTVCPYCSNESNKVPQEDNFLPLKAVVGGRFLVGKATSCNPSEVVYNAFDLEVKKPVTLHELFPKGMLTRGEGNYCLVNVGKASEFIDTKDSFLKLWKKLYSIEGYTALSPVYDVFEDLGTVYAVTEFLGDGKTLREYLLEKEQGYISWDEARVLLMPVVSALGELHNAGIVHGAISPTNLVINTKGKLKIAGFAIPEIRSEKGGIEAEIFDGYAAVEQYGLGNAIGPCTDIYAFAAVLYRTLIGSVPMSASSRLTNDKLMIPGKFAEQLPAYVINALVNALQILPEDRTSSVELLRNELSASPAAAGTAAEAYSSLYEEEVEQYEIEEEEEAYSEEEYVEPEAPQGIKKSTIVVFVISVVLALGILVAALIGIKGFSDKDKDEDTGKNSVETTDSSDPDASGENKDEFKSIKLPDFKGDLYDDIKNNEEYKKVLVFKTEYIDSPEERGTVVSQSINAGTEVTSISPKTIVLKISNGLEVPDVVGEKLQDAIDAFKTAGFKNVKSESAKVASSEEESNSVYRVAYEDTKSGDWAEIPGDKRLSSGDIIILYYFGEYATTTEPVTELVTVAPDTQADATVSETQASQPQENPAGEPQPQ